MDKINVFKAYRELLNFVFDKENGNGFKSKCVTICYTSFFFILCVVILATIVFFTLAGLIKGFVLYGDLFKEIIFHIITTSATFFGIAIGCVFGATASENVGQKKEESK